MIIYDSLLLLLTFHFLLIVVFYSSHLLSLASLLMYNVCFLYVIFGGGELKSLLSNLGIIFIIPLFIFNLHILLIIFLAKKWSSAALSLLPILISLLPNQSFMIPIHPWMLWYQIPFVSDFLPRFSYHLLNTIIIYIMPVSFFLMRGFILLIPLALFFLSFNAVNKYYSTKDVKNIRVLVVQVGLLVEQGNDIDKIESYINRYNNIDLVVFSESTEFGYKPGARRIQTEHLVDNLKKKRNIAFILNLYGFAENGINYNYRSSLFIDKGRLSYYPKLKLVPLWETRGVFYQDEDFYSDYLSVPSSNTKEVYYSSLGINVSMYSCFEAFFFHKLDIIPDLNVVQSRYTDIKSTSISNYNKTVVFGDVLSYFMTSASYIPLLSVQDSGGSMYVDLYGVFDYKFFMKSLYSPLLAIDVAIKK